MDLTYLRARWLDPRSGRFTQADPLDAEHAYAYVLNTPVNRIDPTGYFSEETIKNSLNWRGFFGADWGELETGAFGYRPKFSGLLTLLKRAGDGDRIRSGRLAWNFVQGMKIKWDPGWTLGVDCDSEKIILSRDKFFGSEDKDLSEYITELSFYGLPYLYLGGGYVYHEHTLSWGQKESGIVRTAAWEVYRDGATSLVPDMLVGEVNLPAEPIPGLDIGAGPKARVAFDRFGYMYSSVKLAPSGTSIGFSIPGFGGINGVLGAIYFGYYHSPAHVSESQRPNLSSSYIREKWADEGIKTSLGFGDADSWQVAYFGVYTARSYTMFTRNYFKPLKIGVSGGYRVTGEVGKLGIPWDNIDNEVTGVSWEEAVNAPAFGAAR